MTARRDRNEAGSRDARANRLAGGTIHTLHAGHVKRIEGEGPPSRKRNRINCSRYVFPGSVLWKINPSEQVDNTRNRDVLLFQLLE